MQTGQGGTLLILGVDSDDDIPSPAMNTLHQTAHHMILMHHSVVLQVVDSPDRPEGEASYVISDSGISDYKE